MLLSSNQILYFRDQAFNSSRPENINQLSQTMNSFITLQPRVHPVLINKSITNKVRPQSARFYSKSDDINFNQSLNVNLTNNVFNKDRPTSALQSNSTPPQSSRRRASNIKA